MPQHAQEIPIVLDSTVLHLYHEELLQDGGQLIPGLLSISFTSTLDAPTHPRRPTCPGQHGPSPFENVEELPQNRGPPILDKFQKYVSWFDTRQKLQFVLEYTAHLLWEPQEGKDGQLTLGQFPEILQML